MEQNEALDKMSDAFEEINDAFQTFAKICVEKMPTALDRDLCQGAADMLTMSMSVFGITLELLRGAEEKVSNEVIH